MKNPLYPSNLITYENIHNYNKCLVITLDKTPNPNIFDKDVEIDFFSNVNVNYKLTSVPMWMIKNIPEFKFKFVMFTISEDDLLKFQFNGTDINDEIINYNLSNACILIPNHNWYWFSEFIEYFIKDGIKELYKYVMDDKYAMLDIPFQHLMKDLSNNYDVCYWRNINKCQINITTPWLLRDINFSDAKEINVNTRTQLNNKCNDYLQDIINKQRYVDASAGIKTHRHNLYYIDEPSNLPINMMINKLLIENSFSTKNKLELVSNCLISKKYCHILLKDPQITQFIQNNMNVLSNKYAYAWLMMYLEEGILKSRIKEEDRCIFTLEQATKLPYERYSRNLYIPLMVEKNYINMFGGYQSNNNINKIELSDLSTFKRRLMTFTNDNRIDIFKNMNWKNIAISGSVIAAACRKIDPLERDGKFPLDIFFNTYYKDSDVDVMCDLPDYVSFIDKVSYMVTVFKRNILEKFPLSQNPIQVEITKNAALQLSNKYVNENYNGKISLDEAYKIYCEFKKGETKQVDSKYSKIDEVVSIDNFKYFIYDNDKPNTYGENIKFNISSPHLSRKFEVFKIKFNFLATVSRFHLPCVRGYYDGNQVYLLPSAISALLTNKCIDYKYFSGVRSPFEIILKYVFRGYSIFLNKREMIKIVEYIKNTEKWKKLFKIHDNFRVNTFQAYYSNPFVLLNVDAINYYDYRKYYEHNLISPIISSLGYVIPYS